MRKISLGIGIAAFSALALALAGPERPRAEAAPVCAEALCGFEQAGVASYYAASLDGLPTAMGERYDHDALTAAHRDLPLGSVIEVTNLANERSVVLRVNDRGPFVRGRVLDVSGAAAEALDFRRAGLAEVRIRYVGRGPAV